MRLELIMLILCATGLALAMYTPYQEPRVCIKLETGPEGELIDGLFCDGDGCRPVTVDWEEIECNEIIND